MLTKSVRIMNRNAPSPTFNPAFLKIDNAVCMHNVRHRRLGVDALQNFYGLFAVVLMQVYLYFDIFIVCIMVRCEMVSLYPSENTC